MVDPGDMQSVGTQGWWVTQAGEIVTIFPGVNTTVFERVLSMTCSVFRNTQDQTDESGKLAPPSFTQVGLLVSCLAEGYSVRNQQVQEIDTAKTVIERINIMFAADIDILINDEIRIIVRKSNGSVFDNGPLYVQELNQGDDFVGGAIHHIECILKREEVNQE